MVKKLRKKREAYESAMQTVLGSLGAMASEGMSGSSFAYLRVSLRLASTRTKRSLVRRDVNSSARKKSDREVFCIGAGAMDVPFPPG